jgi:hypothetical protein
MTADDIRLVLRLARGDRAAAVRLAEARTAPFDDLADRALAEGLGVVLFRGWSALPSGAPFVLSDSYLDALRARAERQAVRTAAQIDALAHITDTFAAAGLSFILLKGPYLAARFYGDPAGREFVDLDLLVRRADRARASERLTSIGYARRSRVLGSEALTAWFVHAFDYADARTYLDLHWCLSRHPPVQVDERRLWSSRGEWTVGGRGYAVLDAEHDIVFGALSFLRDVERGRPKAKNVVDLVQLVAAADTDLDWEAVFGRARGEGTHGPLVDVLSLCLDVADARDLAPRLDRALTASGRRAAGTPTDVPFVLPPVIANFGNKRWVARAYDAGWIRWLLWWVVSLPFRLGVHRGPPPAARRRI